jgi:5-methyltetrahydrofolate--homocysteine methyltransferase
MRPYDHPILILDGACGTNLQEMLIPHSAWQGKEGCNELLNLTAPASIIALHAAFVEAGAMVIETNTFGANRIVLEEYGLADQVEAINRAAVANVRQAIGSKANTYIAGSIGPGTKLPSLGHIGVDALASAYEEQIRALVLAGVDMLIVETCQDLLQIKTALTTCFAILEDLGQGVGDAQQQKIPVMASVTIERSGTMLVGSDIAAAAVTFEPYPLFSFGLNCATGPMDMESHIRYLSRNWPGRISCVPNQGLPEVVQGMTCYPLDPISYSREMLRFVSEYGVSVVGGCCGTTPAHTRQLVETLAGVQPAVREVQL